jgi:hypothetical protein
VPLKRPPLQTSRWVHEVHAPDQGEGLGVAACVLGIIFYGFGLGLFGRLAPAPAAAFGVAFYTLQLFFSQWWLARYRF